MSKWRLTRYGTLLSLALLCPFSVYAGSINDLDEMFIGVWSPFGRNWEKTIPVCVSADAGETAYRVRASSLNNPTRFNVGNNIGDKVRYQVFWYTGTSLKRRERLQPDRDSRRAYPFVNTGSCAGTPNAKLRVKINKRDINRAIPAIYDDTLMLTLSPI